MATWIFPCNKDNIKYIDETYEDAGKINWYQNRNLQIGDIIYVYESSPAMTVRYKGIVTDVSFYLQADDENTHSYVEDTIFNDGPFFELTYTHKFQLSDLLKYSDLKDNGLKSRLMGPQHTDSNLELYLQKVENIENDTQATNNYLNSLSLDYLSKLAKNHSTATVKTTTTKTIQYVRNPYIAQYAKKKANGICQLCNQSAPFTDKNGDPYLESHHIIWLSNGGSDSIDNVVALCPNCHKKMHIVNDKNDIKILSNKSK